MTSAMKERKAEKAKNDSSGYGEGANQYKVVSKCHTEEVAMADNSTQNYPEK